MSRRELTCLVATFDRPRMLRTALQSILLASSVAEPLARTRILVLDDASPGDDTKSLCHALGVEYMRNEVNDGFKDPAQVRKMGLSHVDTEFFAMFDDDDVMLPRFVADHIENIGDADVCYGGYVVVDADLRPIRTHRPLQVSLGDLLAGHNAVNDHCLVRTSPQALQAWRPERRSAMPYGAWLEMVVTGSHFVALRTPTYLYRQHGSQMTATMGEDTVFVRNRDAVLAHFRDVVAKEHGGVPSLSFGLRLRKAVPNRAKQILRRLSATARPS